ncbi:MAG: hypothetical protein GX587_14840 [Bacteroidales bacterium]|nr:hypothetical protein [Bacteroidales bacterium]
MSKFSVKIIVEAESPENVTEVGNLLQFAVTNIDRNDLVKLLSKVKQNPGLVKTALKFI